MKVIILLFIGIWIGMLIGISFVEAPLKFQAPNMTITLGLGIGQLVFSALNKFEIFFSIVLAIWLFSQGRALDKWTILCLSIPITMVALQSFWLLPRLSLRVDKLLADEIIPRSNDHLYYVLMEISKIITLTWGFIKTYNYE